MGGGGEGAPRDPSRARRVRVPALGATLLRTMTIALNIDRDFFDTRFHEPISVLRMIHYPPRHTASGHKA